MFLKLALATKATQFCRAAPRPRQDLEVQAVANRPRFGLSARGEVGWKSVLHSKKQSEEEVKWKPEGN